MRSRALTPLIAAALLLLAAVSDSASADPLENDYGVEAMVPDAYLGTNGEAVIDFQMIPGQPNEALVVRQSGHIYRVAMDGTFAPTLWGNISTKVTFGGEQGLLSLAFSPDFTATGRVYLYYTPGSPTPTVLARYQASATDLNEASEVILLNIEEFASNHNGGKIAFDSAGLLYLSLGDGGGSNDPNEKGQALDTLLGKVIRINVSGASGYTIPAGNPFNDGTGPIREEIFAYGFRNPFRMTIDAPTDQIWLGDVGQNNIEEVDRVTVGGNYGWDCYEGTNQFEWTTDCQSQTFQSPRAEYSHSFGFAVTGGAIYRGSDFPELDGWYVYGDFYSGRIWAVDTTDNSPAVPLTQEGINISSFTVLPDGEMAVVSYDEGIYRLAKQDADGDGDIAINDNCPDWPNPSQNLPPWTVPSDDSDCDGFSRVREAFAGTLPRDRCMNLPGINDEPPPDAWPSDFNDNQITNGADWLTFNNKFGSTAPGPPYNVRWDLNMNGVINGADMLHLNQFMGKSCT